MSNLGVYNFATLDGYIADANDDKSWHVHGGEEAEYATESASNDGMLLFGRRTYEEMTRFWPTPKAHEMFPELAKSMGDREKIVFSRTMTDPGWRNVRVASDLLGEVTRLKRESPRDMTILGSGTIVSQLADAGLIDSFAIMLDPVAIGGGKSMFGGMKNRVNLRLTSTRAFKSGVVLLNYVKA